MNRSGFLKAVGVGALIGGISGFAKGCYKVITRKKAEFEDAKFHCYGEISKMIGLADTLRTSVDDETECAKYEVLLEELTRLRDQVQNAKSYDELKKIGDLLPDLVKDITED